MSLLTYISVAGMAVYYEREGERKEEVERKVRGSDRVTSTKLRPLQLNWSVNLKIVYKSNTCNDWWTGIVITNVFQ